MLALPRAAGQAPATAIQEHTPTIPTIAVHDSSPGLGILTEQELLQCTAFLRLLQELPTRRQRKNERNQQLATAETRLQYQDVWNNEIKRYSVNHPKSALRTLFKRPHKTDARQHRRSDERFQLAASLANDEGRGTEADWEANKPKLEDLFKRQQNWNSWQYRAAYPRLTQFLRAADPGVKSRCEVSVQDFLHGESGCLDEWVSAGEREIVSKIRGNGKALRLDRSQTLLDHPKLWEYIRSRFKAKPQGSHVFGRKHSLFVIPCRTLKIVDLSPTCTTLLLGSCPRMDLSYIAPFLERYLSNASWATANLIAMPGEHSMLRNYLLEYHLSFYHVTSRRTNADVGYLDGREVRQVSPFTAGPKAKARRIYEEQLSFVIVGHGGDVYTNIQLAEKYSCDPEDDMYESPFYLRSPRKATNSGSGASHDDATGIAFFVGQLPPCSALLAWIANSMRHVVARWQSAISAVDSEIDSTFQATFHGDKHSLLSDDSSFSRSKKYVWAVQVYRVFEKKLDETVRVWRDFEQNCLEKLDHDQLHHKEESLMIIRAAVAALEAKRDNVQRRRNEVSDMKDGLFATSQLLDSRVTVRQNDNIRLLTYVNLLFLPLAFCTSVFGMATILPDHVHGAYFAVTLCAVTVFTVFLVFNLQLMSEIIEGVIGRGTRWLRRFMSRHHRPDWRKTGQALQTSRDAQKIIVQNRLRRTSSWMYFLFVLEAIFVMIPVREIEAARLFWGLRRHLSMPRDRPRADQLTGVPLNEAGTQNIGGFKLTFLIIISVIRALFLPLWLALVMVETLFVSLWLLLSYTLHNPAQTHPDQGERDRKAHPWRIPLQLIGLFQESEKQLPPMIQMKIRRWRALLADEKEEATYQQHRIDALEKGQDYYGRSDIFVATGGISRPANNAAANSGLQVPSALGGRRRSESSVSVGRVTRESSPTRPSRARSRTASMTFFGR